MKNNYPNMPYRPSAEAAAAPNPLKDLKVKMSVVVRMDKEVKFYHKEAAENEAVIKKLEAEGKDGYDTKQAKEVLQESYMMIPDSKNRFQKSLEDLHGFLDEHFDDAAILAAPEILADAKALLAANGMALEVPDEAGGAAEEEFAEGEVF